MKNGSFSLTCMKDSFDNLTFCIHTFGCQMNKHDSERIIGMLEALGASEVSDIESADIAIFMTCCVREAADVRLKGQVASMKNIPLRASSPLSKRIIAIGGCIGQRDGAELVGEMPHVDIVFGTQNLSSLPHLVWQRLAEGAAQVEVLDSANGFSTDLPSHREHPWAAWLPITVGCNNFCSYCIVPYVRGREKSRPIEEIEREASALVASGVKEITLLGQNVNSYGRDLYGAPRFDEVLDRVAATGVRYLRFATSHPKDLTDGVIERFAQLPNLAPALHLPVQSGSNRVLSAMNRRYTREEYLDLVDKVRAARPGIALSTDIIVGFPGEKEEDFQATCDLVERVGYNQVFTFIYSKRAGTPAAAMEDDTPAEVIQARFDRLVKLVEAKAWEANQVDDGSEIEMLIENRNKRRDHSVTGHSPKNQTVHAICPEDVSPEGLEGRIARVKIEKARTWYLLGRIIGFVD